MRFLLQNRKRCCKYILNAKKKKERKSDIVNSDCLVSNFGMKLNVYVDRFYFSCTTGFSKHRFMLKCELDA